MHQSDDERWPDASRSDLMLELALEGDRSGLERQARAGMATEVRALLVEGLRMQVWIPDEDEPLRIAELRAATRIALPDRYVLGLAEFVEMPLATFDDRLGAAARSRGVLVATG